MAVNGLSVAVCSSGSGCEGVDATYFAEGRERRGGRRKASGQGIAASVQSTVFGFRKIIKQSRTRGGPEGKLQRKNKTSGVY